MTIEQNKGIEWNWLTIAVVNNDIQSLVKIYQLLIANPNQLVMGNEWFFNPSMSFESMAICFLKTINIWLKFWIKQNKMKQQTIPCDECQKQERFFLICHNKPAMNTLKKHHNLFHQIYGCQFKSESLFCECTQTIETDSNKPAKENETKEPKQNESEFPGIHHISLNRNQDHKLKMDNEKPKRKYQKPNPNEKHWNIPEKNRCQIRCYFQKTNKRWWIGMSMNSQQSFQIKFPGDVIANDPEFHSTNQDESGERNCQRSNTNWKKTFRFVSGWN